MASGAVWGIDIGQCALKALRCRVHEDGKRVVADAFDYIEYPKILSQPGSDPAELIGDALKQFLLRNSVLGDRVAVSVSGQAGLARFIKLPPVEAKKIPDIVRYEARQQIPFDLNDVIWDYQRMGGGSEEEGFALETEIGLFAMKRDAVFRALEPFVKADIEVDVVQLTPLVLYNFLVFDQLGELPSPDEYDPENPPESVVVISLGTDATDLVISNGYRVWQRSVPLGGNHFTKALTKELKLTFAKAEHLKRNATAASDPKAVFQAMRPVFSDLLTELQRSISYFSNLERSAKIGRVMALGNAMKLPGLRRYLSQSLGFEIEKPESFGKLVGSQVVATPSFQENLLSFGVSYGLTLQGLGKGEVRTNLLPKEIIYDRMVKRKKPWAVAAAALLLLACSISYAAYSLALGTVAVDRWKPAESEAGRVIGEAGRLDSEHGQALNEFKSIDEIGQHLVSNVEGRVRWLELLKAVNACLPKSEVPPTSGEDEAAAASGENDKKPKDWVKEISDREELYITNLDCQRTEDVSEWYSGVKQWDETAPMETENDGGFADPGAAPAPASSPAPMGVPATPGNPGGFGGGPAGFGGPSGSGDSGGGFGESPSYGPKGPGWIIRICGHHYHNKDRKNQGAQYVRNTLIENLRVRKVELPIGEGGEMKEVTMEELGIGYPVLVEQKVEEYEVPNPNADTGATALGGMGGMPGLGGIGGRPGALAGPRNDASVPDVIKLDRCDFVVHFCWQPDPPDEELESENPEENTFTPFGQP